MGSRGNGPINTVGVVTNISEITPVAPSRVSVNTVDWQSVSGKSRPSGRGTWAFSTSRRPQNLNDENEVLFIFGSYSDAKKQAQAHFGARGVRNIFVLG